MKKAHVLYFLMGTAAVIFASADTIAEFDRDPTTHTATYWIKRSREHPVFLSLAVAFCVWIPLHFFWDGFPL